MIYETERASFMADHKSVSAQLTLGNFPTPFSNQTRSIVTASQGDPPGAEAAFRTLVGLRSLLPRPAGERQKRGSAKGPGNWERGQKIGRPHWGRGTLELWKEPKQLSAPERFRSGNGGGSFSVSLGKQKPLVNPSFHPSIVALPTFGEPLILRDCKLHKTVYKSSA